MTTVTFTASGSWTAAAALADVQAWGSGGGGGAGTTGGTGPSGGGGGGGEFAEEPSLALTAGNVYAFTVGTGGGSTNTSFPGDSVTVLAHHATSSINQNGTAGGSGSTNTTHFNGGLGAQGTTTTNPSGGGGGGAGGPGGVGGGGVHQSASTSTGGAGGTGGSGGGGNGGQGGDGNALSVNGRPGVLPGGGGGGGSGRSGGTTGGTGAAGQITIIYTSSQAGTATLAGVGTMTANPVILSPTGAPGPIAPGLSWLRRYGYGYRQQQPGFQIQTFTNTATLTGVGTMTAFGSAPQPAVVNAWANNYGQGTTFTTITSALQSCVVPLTSGNAIMPGSGTPTEGNWLFTIASWTQDPQIINVHTGVSDDIHSWWRQFPAAGPGGETRTSVSYTPNIARTVGNVYVAPDMEIAAINVIVVEVQGLGAWDTVSATNANYAGNATSLNLACSAPAQASFFIAGIGGDDASASQAFAPSGWSALTQQVQTNGSDNLADNVLNVAFKTNSSSSQSVTGTASGGSDLSGFLLGVDVAAPVPSGNNNPNWPYIVFEAAFGAGFNTPNSEITTGSNTNPVNWTDLTSRLWDYDETTGIQYQLGELQATNLQLELDNFDGALSPLNTGSPYYSNAMNSNMAFQGSISPWSAGDGGTIALSTAQAHASAPGAISSSSMQMHGDGSTANPAAFSEQVAVSPSWAYTASAWFYSATSWASGVGVAVNWYTSSHVYISTSSFTSVTPLPAATWVQAVATGVTSPSNAAFGQVITQVNGTPTSGQLFYIAEAAMVPGSSPVMTGLVAPGTPLRLRAALGTLGGDNVNRWYVIQRNAGEWMEQIDEIYRRFVAVTGTDLWAALSSVPPTFYRSEVVEDAPYAWWPMDDQPQSFGVLPTTLLNAATGNTNVLDINVSANGAQFQQVYNQSGAAAGGTATPTPGNNLGATVPPGIAIYSVGITEGWMFGDPQGTSPTLDTGNAVTANPGSAAWAALGQAGSTGKYGWYLACNDSSFPPLSAGVTAEIWFNYLFYASAEGFQTSNVGFGNFAPALQQPYSTPLTIWEMATGSNPVAVLQLDTSGHLNFITYNGSTGTSHSIYTASDLRSNSWHMVTVTMTTTGWEVWLDGGANAAVTGTATGMTSAWTYLMVNADFGAGGGANPAGIAHGGNAAFAHLAIYPYILPYYRVMDHYWAAVTAFGQLPAPTGPGASWSSNPVTSGGTTQGQYAPDGTDSGSYQTSNGVAISGRVAALAPGGITSGGSAWVTTTTEGITISIGFGIGFATPWIGWTGVSPQFAVYTSNAPGTEAEAAISSGSGESFTSGYGGSASGHGVAHVSGGDGTSPPSTPSAIGDTVGQRIERLLRGGRCTSPQRSIDPASLLVQAPGTQGGGIQAGASVQEIQQSDNGFLYVDNVGNLVYWQRSHLASQYGNPVWQLGPTTSAGRIPYYPSIQWVTDPQRIWNAITVAPFSPSGAELPLVVPQDYSSVLQSQVTYGAQPLQVISWLQDSSSQQEQANWLFSVFGAPQRRAERVKIDAAPYPAAWKLVMGICVGDVIQIEDWQIGGGGNVYTYRVTEIKRRLSFGAHHTDMTGTVELIADFEPSSYWGT